ncbi:MAG TPA: hypothetical protein PLT77_06430, partial [Burkholderiaceae bacterium]|nr:hypothetical protein [Burkholderiaceae bacterium]
MAFAAAALPGRVSVGWTVLATVAGAVFVHATALAASLQAVHRESRASRRLGVALLLLPVLLLMWVGPFIDRGGTAKALSWFGMRFERLPFFAVSMVAFAGWAVFGAYRSFCRELQVRTRPWAWPAFSLWVAAWADCSVACWGVAQVLPRAAGRLRVVLAAWAPCST